MPVLDFLFSLTAWKSVTVIPVWNWPFCQLSNRASSDLHQCTQTSPASPGREIQDFKVSVLNSVHFQVVYLCQWCKLEATYKSFNSWYRKPLTVTIFFFVDSMRCLTSRRTPHPPPSPICHKPPPWIYQRSFRLKRSQSFQEGLEYQVKDFEAGPLLWQKLKIWCTALLMLPILILTDKFLEWAPVFNCCYYVKKMSIIGKSPVLTICCYQMLIVLTHAGNINCTVH